MGCLGWAVGLAVLFWICRRNSREAAIAGGVVLSHWILDAIVHRPDLPLIPGAEVLVGLGVWNSIPATIALELGSLTAGFVIYLRSTRKQDRIGSYGLWCLVAFLVPGWLGNAFGPPPASELALAVSVLVGLSLIVLWGYWVDRHRQIVVH